MLSQKLGRLHLERFNCKQEVSTAHFVVEVPELGKQIVEKVTVLDHKQFRNAATAKLLLYFSQTQTTETANDGKFAAEAAECECKNTGLCLDVKCSEV